MIERVSESGGIKRTFAFHFLSLYKNYAKLQEMAPSQIDTECPRMEISANERNKAPALAFVGTFIWHF